MRAYVLKEGVLLERMSSGWHILQYMLCFTGRHFLLDDMFYLWVCIIAGHVLQFETSYWSACFTGGQIL